MSNLGRARVWWLVGLALAALALGPVPPGAARAQDAAAAGSQEPGWQLLSLPGPVRALFAPSSGALLADTAQGLMRSDDGGDTWRQLALGPAVRVAAVDPRNHDTLFAFGEDGVYKSTDGGRGWAGVFPYPRQNQNSYSIPVNAASLARGSCCGYMGLVISPADDRVVYLSAVEESVSIGGAWTYRSTDGGLTWQAPGSLWLCPVIPDASDPRRLFRGGLCGNTHGAQSAPLWRSTDQGATWTTWLGTFSGFLRGLSGGAAPWTGTYYAAFAWPGNYGTPVASYLVKTDDDGATSTVVLDVAGPDGGQRGSPIIQSVVADPTNPDHVYVAVTAGGDVVGATPVSGKVMRSLDGGTSWADLGDQDLGSVGDLVLGVDGRNLYVASKDGLWRLPLDPAAGLPETAPAGEEDSDSAPTDACAGVGGSPRCPGS